MSEGDLLGYSLSYEYERLNILAIMDLKNLMLRHG